MVPHKPLRILSLDGGGIRGISSLLILEDIMEKIREAEGLQHVPRPCERFDLIGGTSTGGIIAIMLGRLGMTVDECIRAYREVAQQAFTPKSTSFLRRPRAGAFSAESLKNAIQQVVREFCVDAECVAHRRLDRSAFKCPHSDIPFRDEACTKTVVLAITKDNVDAPPTLFTTYDKSLAFGSCTIWQVARATSAATTFFKSIKVGRDEIEFIDAGFGYNNPCEILIEEGQRQFPDHTQLQIFSIGTGLGDVVTIDDSWRSIIGALKKMATSSKHIAARLNSRYGDSHYYRFNVDRGLQDITLSDWEQASKISAHTRNYLAENERMIKKSARILISTTSTADGHGEEQEEAQYREEAPSAIEGLGQATASALSLADGQTAARMGGISSGQSRPTYYSIPSLRNRRFVGREKILHMLKQKLFSQEESQCAVVFGLGGVGKTQVALQLAHWVKEHIPNCSIFWLPALSSGSFTQACTEIVRELAIPKNAEDENARESVQRYLSSEKAGPWFLIVDNADDSDVVFGSVDEPDGICDFLPESDVGVTLFTTRSRQLAVSVAGSDVIELQEMDSQEANIFLEKSLIQKSLLYDEAAKNKLLEELKYLPLAIAQAAAYLNTVRVSIAKYLDLLHGTEQEMVDLMSRQFRDNTRYKGSENAVATTWLVSFDQIRKVDHIAANLLSFMSSIEPKAIPLSILPSVESEEQMVHAIGILDGYAFVSKREDDKMLDMHSLVHLATRIWLQRNNNDMQATRNAICHIAAKFPSNDYANLTLWRDYLPHALRVLQGKKGSDIKENYDLYLAVGRCLKADGRIKEAVNCVEACYQWRKNHFTEEHPSRLVSQYILAEAYRVDGQIKKAVELLKHVVAVNERTLSEEHSYQLASQHALAGAYQANGQIKKAVELLEYVVIVQERILSKEHPSRLISQHTLAGAYRADGQIKKAIELLEFVIKIRERILSEEHPDRLASQHELARAYRANGQVKKAVELLELIIRVRDRTLSEEHPDRLSSQHELAGAYRADGQIKKAIELLEYVVTVRERMLSEEHPNRLASQHELAGAYRANGQIKKTVELLEHVVTVRERILSEEHPDRLASQHALAGAYQVSGQIKKAIELLEHVVTVRERTLSEEHPSRLSSQHELAGAYQANDQIKKAVELLELVIKIRERILSEEHSNRLASQHALAGAYRADGQVKKAVELLEHVVAIRERTLSKKHPDRLTSQHALAIVYQADGQIKKAVELLEHVVTVRERTLSKEHPDRLASQHALAKLYQAND